MARFLRVILGASIACYIIWFFWVLLPERLDGAPVTWWVFLIGVLPPVGIMLLAVSSEIHPIARVQKWITDYRWNHRPIAGRRRRAH